MPDLDLNTSPHALKLDEPEKPKAPVTFREFGDPIAIRHAIYDRTLKSAQEVPAISNAKHSLSLSDVAFEGPPDFSLHEQKRAILEGRTLSRRLKGTLTLSDLATGQPLARKRTTLAQVPYYSPRGTFILNGVDYSLASQLRLRPGVYTRLKENGAVDSHINVTPGQGVSHHIEFEPSTGIFQLKFGSAHYPLVPVLKAMGVTDSQIRQHWGELAAANTAKADPSSLDRLYSKLIRGPVAPDADSRRQALSDALQKMPLDPEVTKATLGHPYTNVGPDVYLAASKKLLALSRREVEPDDRDHLAYMTVHGPEDLIAERFLKDKSVLRRALWKATLKGNLDGVPPGLFTKSLHEAITGSGLGQPGENVNPLQILEQRGRISRMGVGGIPSLDSIPDESRSVQPSHFGFIDFLATPESMRAGVDSRVASGAVKGSDGRMYAPFVDARTGERVLRSPSDLANKVVAFPGELAKGAPTVAAMVGGKTRYVPRATVHYELPDMEAALGPLSNLVPMKSAVKGQRAAMGQRMTAQALPLVDPEAPFVQSGVPGSNNESFEQRYGEHAGAIRSKHAGHVVEVTPDKITVRTADGQVHEHELARDLAANRKTGFDQTPVVQVGQPIRPGDLLARSNYTNEKGEVALGKNARVAYVPYSGPASANYEDAWTVSRSFAKRMTSQHMYQHQLQHENGLEIGKKAHVSLFPGKYERRVLDNFDESGAIKPGTPVHFDDPLILAVKKREQSRDQVYRGRERSYVDKTETWRHHEPGVVTDVAHTPEGVLVTVKSTAPLEEGDKLCFDPETSLLTRAGWKSVADIDVDDELATLNPRTEQLEYQKPTHLHRYAYSGPMFYLNTKQLNMLVTPNHRLWAEPRGGEFIAIPAEDLFKSEKRWRFKKNCKWTGIEQEWMEFEAPEGMTWRCDTQFLSRIPMDDWLEFLGYYVSEGWSHSNSGHSGVVKIGQFRKSPHWQAIHDNLSRIGFRFTYDDREQRFVMYSDWLYRTLAPLGDAYTKYVPEYVQTLSCRQLRIFFEAYMAGDGHKGAAHEYGTSSWRLSEDLQVICLKLGWAGTVSLIERTDSWQKHPHWRMRVNRRQLLPVVQRGRDKKYPSNRMEMVPYTGDVFSVTVQNHLVYCKREDKTYWSHNSGRYG